MCFRKWLFRLRNEGLVLVIFSIFPPTILRKEKNADLILTNVTFIQVWHFLHDNSHRFCVETEHILN